MAETTYSTETIARLLDLTPRRVQQLARDGYIPRAGPGQFDLVGAVQGYIRYLRACANQDATVRDFEAERARLTKARADVAEMEAAQRRGELVATDAVAEQVGDEYARVRARLRAIPSSVAALVPNDMRTIVQDRLEDGIEQALEELASEADDSNDYPGAPELG